jgi:hypothetical protein
VAVTPPVSPCIDVSYEINTYPSMWSMVCSVAKELVYTDVSVRNQKIRHVDC